MHGQDIPWLLAHWADRQPDHPALVWDPRDGRGPPVDLRRAARATSAGWPPAWRPGRRQGRQGAHPRRELPRDGAGLAGVRHRRRGRRDHQHQVGGRRDRPTSSSKARCVAAITQPQYASMVADAAPGAEVDRRHRRQQRRAGRRPTQADHGFDTFDTLFGDAADWTGRPAEPMLPFGIMFTSGTTSKPKAVVHTHANADLGQPASGPRNIDLGTDDTLPDLPAVLPRERPELVASSPVLGVGATAVLMPKWSTEPLLGGRRPHGVTHISLMPFVHGRRSAARTGRPRRTLRVGVFGLIMPDLDRMFGIDGVRRLRHDRDGDPCDHRQAAASSCRPARWATSRRATRSPSSTRRPASCAPRARPASCGCAAPGASSSSSSTSTTPRPTPRRSRTAGSRPATW